MPEQERGMWEVGRHPNEDSRIPNREIMGESLLDLLSLHQLWHTPVVPESSSEEGI
jgi:hypothetical protein